MEYVEISAPVIKPLNANPENGTMEPEKDAFVPAKTIKEANAYAMDVLGIPRASYKGCDVETANEWNRGLKDSFDRFPELKKNFGFVGEAHERRIIISYSSRLVFLTTSRWLFKYKEQEIVRQNVVRKFSHYK